MVLTLGLAETDSVQYANPAETRRLLVSFLFRYKLEVSIVRPRSHVVCGEACQAPPLLPLSLEHPRSISRACQCWRPRTKFHTTSFHPSPSIDQCYPPPVPSPRFEYIPRFLMIESRDLAELDKAKSEILPAESESTARSRDRGSRQRASRSTISPHGPIGLIGFASVNSVDLHPKLPCKAPRFKPLFQPLLSTPAPWYCASGGGSGTMARRRRTCRPYELNAKNIRIRLVRNESHVPLLPKSLSSSVTSESRGVATRGPCRTWTDFDGHHVESGAVRPNV